MICFITFRRMMCNLIGVFPYMKVSNDTCSTVIVKSFLVVISLQKINPSNVLLKIYDGSMSLSILEDGISFDDRYLYQLGIIGGCYVEGLDSVVENQFWELIDLSYNRNLILESLKVKRRAVDLLENTKHVCREVMSRVNRL